MCQRFTARPSSNSQQLVRLQTQSPTWMLLTVPNGCTRIFGHCGAIHRLQKKVLERQTLVVLRIGTYLWIDKFELVSVGKRQIGASLRAYADPVDTRRWKPRAVRFYRDRKAAIMERRHRALVQLKERLSTRADDEAAAVVAIRRPAAGDGVGQIVCTGKTTAVRTHANEIGVAKGADRRRAILFATRPQVAPRESTEDGSPAGMKAFTLQGEENLLHGIVRHTDPDPSCRCWRRRRGEAGTRRSVRTRRQSARDHSSWR